MYAKVTVVKIPKGIVTASLAVFAKIVNVLDMTMRRGLFFVKLLRYTAVKADDVESGAGGSCTRTIFPAFSFPTIIVYLTNDYAIDKYDKVTRINTDIIKNMVSRRVKRIKRTIQ